ncbi:hypothetical protein FACS1894159_04750 [Bacteroidia bacterium]|nr:hypothetical protein FACS1894159_04750 [Bacteroidia bacterium]
MQPSAQKAQSYGAGSAEYGNIMLEIISKCLPDDPTANLNAAAAMIDNGEYATAKRYLSKYGDTPQVWNNMGAILLLEDDPDGAQALLEKVSAAGIKEAAHNLDKLKKKRAGDIRMKRYQQQ